jgi:hypothetical protein
MRLAVAFNLQLAHGALRIMEVSRQMKMMISMMRRGKELIKQKQIKKTKRGNALNFHNRRMS